MEKGEIANFEQFFLLSHCFQKSSAAKASKCVYRWERVKMNYVYMLSLSVYNDYEQNRTEALFIDLNTCSSSSNNYNTYVHIHNPFSLITNLHQKQGQFISK